MFSHMQTLPHVTGRARVFLVYVTPAAASGRPVVTRDKGIKHIFVGVSLAALADCFMGIRSNKVTRLGRTGMTTGILSVQKPLRLLPCKDAQFGNTQRLALLRSCFGKLRKNWHRLLRTLHHRTFDLGFCVRLYVNLYCHREVCVTEGLLELVILLRQEGVCFFMPDKTGTG